MTTTFRALSTGGSLAVFPRDRLYARLDIALKAPVTLVIADRDLGKSTLMRDYAVRRKLRHVTLLAGPEHADAGTFMADLGALAAGGSRTANAARSSYDRASFDARAAAASWSREYAEAFSTTTIVLDDLHHLLADEDCCAFLGALIDATTPALRWVLLAREAGRLPIPRWLATGIADLPLESADLRVTHDELAETVHALGLRLDVERRGALLAATGGWPLGSSVALATGSLDGPLERERVYDYLVETALAHFAPREHERIFETAYLGRFDATLLRALECDPSLGTRLVLRGLLRSLAGDEYVYYAPCLERLRTRVERLTPGDRTEVMQRAASALQVAGRWSDALALHVTSGDEEAIVRGIDARGFKAIDHGEIAITRRALSVLSEPVLSRHPIALALQASLASIDESFDVSEAWFRMALDAATALERRAIVIRYAMDLVRRGRSDAVELLEAEAAREEYRTDADADAALWGLLGTAYVAARRDADAQAAARRALRLLPGVVDDRLRARVLHQASYVALSVGEWDAARDLAQRALTRAYEASLFDLAARALSVLFNVAWLHDDDVPAARHALSRLEEAGRKACNDGLRLYAVMNAYALEVDAGDMRSIERLDAYLGEMRFLITPTVTEALLSAQAMRAAWDGRFGHAYDLLASGAPSLFEDDRAAYRWAEIALYAAAAGKHDESQAAECRSRAILHVLDATQALPLRSAAYLAIADILLGYDVAALDLLDDAESSARPKDARLHALFQAVRALHASHGGEIEALLFLDDALQALAAVDLAGVARFIGMLPLPAERRERAHAEASR